MGGGGIICAPSDDARRSPHELNSPPMSVLLPAICARCNGSGWVPLADDSLRVEPCGCQGDLRRRQRIAASNIPRRYYPHCTLETFYDKNSAVLRSARNRV